MAARERRVERTAKAVMALLKKAPAIMAQMRRIVRRTARRRVTLVVRTKISRR